MNFRFPRDQVVHLETAANLCASRRQANNFSQFVLFFEVGGMTKHLMTGPTGNSEFCFPSTLDVLLGFASGNVKGPGETKLTVSLGASHYKCLLLPVT